MCAHNDFELQFPLAQGFPQRHVSVSPYKAPIWSMNLPVCSSTTFEYTYVIKAVLWERYKNTQFNYLTYKYQCLGIDAQGYCL